MDNTVYNGYKCGLCSRWLASKYSLERHIRLKHKSNLDDTLENGPPAKKTMMADDEKLNNTPSLAKYVPYVEREEESGDSSKESNNSDPDTDLDNNNHMDSEKTVYANKAGWIESDNNEKPDEEIDNSKNEIEGGIMDIEDKTENNIEENVGEDESGYKYKSLDIIDTPEEMRRRFGACDRFVTFRVKPSTSNYTSWMLELIYGLYDYFKRTYSHDKNDSVGLKFICKNGFCEQEFNIGPKVIKSLNVGEILRRLLQSPFSCCGVLTVCYNHIPYERPKHSPRPRRPIKYRGRHSIKSRNLK